MDLERSFSTDPRLVYARLSGKLLSGLFTPAVGMIRMLEEKRRTQWRMLHLAITLSDWIARDEKMPSTWSALGVPEDEAIDLMTFHKKLPLMFRREDGNLLRVWSVGDNRKDDTTTPPTGSGRNDDISVVIRLRESTR